MTIDSFGGGLCGFVLRGWMMTTTKSLIFTKSKVCRTYIYDQVFSQCSDACDNERTSRYLAFALITPGAGGLSPLGIDFAAKIESRVSAVFSRDHAHVRPLFPNFAQKIVFFLHSHEFFSTLVSICSHFNTRSRVHMNQGWSATN